MIYANGVEVVHGNTPEWRGGTIFYGTEGTIWVDRGPWKSDPENLIKDFQATVNLRQPKNHHDDWIDCIHSGNSRWLMWKRVTVQPRFVSFVTLDMSYAVSLTSIQSRSVCK